MNNKVILLFFPKVNADNTRFMPFSVLHLERMIRNRGYVIELIDEQITPDYDNIIKKHEKNIFLAALTAATGYQIKGAVKFSKKIKEIQPDALTVWCGWHSSLLPEITLKETYVDFVISGQAELPFEQLVDLLTYNYTFENISGLGYKKNGELHINPKAVFSDINYFPEINFALIDPENYIFVNSFSKRCISYFASHGCPFQCEFCSLATVFGGKWYHKKIAQIIKDIRYLKNKAQLDAISFWDDNFFTNKTHALELAQALINNNLNIKWECCTHSGLFNKLFDEKDIALFYKSGLRQVFIGAESGDDDVLKLVHKNIQLEDNLKFVRTLKKFDISPVYLIIVGFPLNPDKDIKATFDMIRKAKLINSKLKIRLHIFVPVPQTKMFDIALEKGLQMPEHLEDYSHFLYTFKPPWLTKDYRWQFETFVNFYLPLANPFLCKEAPGILLKVLTALLSLCFFPFVYLRFRFNCFAFPVGAYVFLSILRAFNKLFSTKLTLGSESYLDKNNLGFYNSYCG